MGYCDTKDHIRIQKVSYFKIFALSYSQK